MHTGEDLKKLVQEKYSEIATQDVVVNKASCCGCGDTSAEVYNIMTDDYGKIQGYVPDADLGLGCGLPTEFAGIEIGDTVIDLGSGAGNDCFVARYETGPNGKIIGIDFSSAMIMKARENAERLGFNNVEFRYGDIEDIPAFDNSADVVISNCVLNLVPDKKQVFSEINRVLKPGGHFSISDIVLLGDLPEALKKDAELYAGCVSGAIQKDEYLDLIRQTGFRRIVLQKEKPIILPPDILSKYLTETEMMQFYNGDTGIYSITVYAEKEGEKESKEPKVWAEPASMGQTGECCGPGGGCGCAC